MKHALLLTAAAIATVSLAACQKPAEKTTDTVAAGGPVNAAQDATAAAVGTMAASSTAATNSTDGFVTGLATSNMYEIRSGQIAQTKGQSAAVKAFGKMMATDHTALTNKAQPAVATSGKPVPTELDQRRKGMIDNLNAAGAADFDQAYLSQQEAAHEETLILLKGYADGGDDAGLKAIAVGAIPKVQAHLEQVRELQAKK